MSDAASPHPLFATHKPELLADYPVVIRLLVQWGDQDAFGHVNNTASIRWFESGRIAYLDAGGLSHYMQHGGQGPILAAVHCNYRRQLSYPDAIYVGSRVTKIGRTSLVMQHAILSESQNVITSDGESVIVMFDYDHQRPIRVAEELRDLVTKLEGRALGE